MLALLAQAVSQLPLQIGSVRLQSKHAAQVARCQSEIVHKVGRLHQISKYLEILGGEFCRLLCSFFCLSELALPCI